MQLKILKENFLHNKILSLLILAICSVTLAVFLIAIEVRPYLTYANLYDQHYKYNEFDISIKANNVLSTGGVYDIVKENDTYEYERVVSYYECALPVTYKNTEKFIQVIEADKEDFAKAFDLSIVPDKSQAVITKEASSIFGVEIGELLKIQVKDEVLEYQVIDIVDSHGLYSGQYAIVGGKDISKIYSGINYKFANHILVDLKDDSKVNDYYQVIKQQYSEYSVVNVLDEELAKTMTTDMVSIVCGISSFLFIVVAILMCNIYNYRLKRQKEFFIVNHQTRYYKALNIIWWIILLVMAGILGYILSNIILNLFNNLFNVKRIYIISGIPFIKSVLFLMLVPLVLYIKNKNIKISKVVKGLILLIGMSSLILGVLFINNINIKKILICIILVILVKLLIDAILYILKFLKPSLVKTYLYKFNRKNYFLKNNVLVQIAMIIVCTIIMASLSYYKGWLVNFSSFIEIEEVVATTSKYVETDKFDSIKMGDNGRLERLHLAVMLGLTGEQVVEYTSIELTDSEKLLFDQDKYIILSKYHQNVFNLDVGDIVDVEIGENIEKFKIFKFIDYPGAQLAIVSDSDYLYKGYVLNSDTKATDIASAFGSNNYFILNFKTFLDSIDVLYTRTVNVISIVFIGIAGFIIIFSMYLFYLDFLYQKENIKKLKLLGMSHGTWKRLNLIKNLLVLSMCVILGNILNYYITLNFDLMLRTVRAISYITYVPRFALISLSIIVINVIVGYIFTNYEYKKI